jgi:hypothetical protein
VRGARSYNNGNYGQRLLRIIVKDDSWIHLGIGVVGHACFLLGSVFFLYESLKRAGTWLFIFGAAGMLIGKLGSALASVEYRRMYAEVKQTQHRQQAQLETGRAGSVQS